MEDSIVYKQWLYDDHTKIVHIINTTGQFTEKKKNLLNCRSSNKPSLESNYRAKSQASYLKMKETFLPGTETVMLLNFSDSYSFLCEDAVHRFHWETWQATLHPSVFIQKIA